MAPVPDLIVQVPAQRQGRGTDVTAYTARKKIGNMKVVNYFHDKIASAASLQLHRLVLAHSQKLLDDSVLNNFDEILVAMLSYFLPCCVVGSGKMTGQGREQGRWQGREESRAEGSRSLGRAGERAGHRAGHRAGQGNLA